MALVYTEEYTAEDFYNHQDISMNLIHNIKDCQTRGPARFMPHHLLFSGQKYQDIKLIRTETAHSSDTAHSRQQFFMNYPLQLFL